MSGHHGGPLAEALFVDRGAFEPSPAGSSVVAMQRVVVRMLFDPAFVERVYRAPHKTLGGLGIEEALITQLVENDRRLWNADRLRRSRALHILMEEFKVSTTLALHEGRSLALLDAFFSSPHFHDAVQLRGYMAMAFVGYLESLLKRRKLRSNHMVYALRLESAMARSRRMWRDAMRGVDTALERARTRGASALWLNAPGVGGVFLPVGTLALVQHIERYLFEVSQVPALALCDDAPRPEPLPTLNMKAGESYLLEPEAGGKVELSGVPGEFIHVIQACEQPRTDKELCKALAAHHISREDALDYAGQLLEGGVLRRVEL